MSALSADERGVHLPCPACGQTNRLRYSQLGQPFRCGQCQHSLAPTGGPGQPVEPRDEAAWTALTQTSPLPALVDFWAPWCGPCRSVAPEVERLASATAGQLLVVKLNTEEFPRIAQTFQIASIPTFVALRNGQEMNRRSGALPAAALQQLAFSARV